jgi:putative glutamine amidotransferase
MIIGINCAFVKCEGRYLNRLADDYCRAIYKAGATPLILPCINNLGLIKQYINLIDGLLLSGAPDIHPSYYKEKILPQTKPILKEKQDFDIELVKTAWDKKIPILAICYGAQLLNVSLGGTLFQDITAQLKVKSHRNKIHKVYISEGSALYQIVSKSNITVNSFHHQAIKKLGRELKISAKTSDGIIEAVEPKDRTRFVIGVQWHPERMPDNPIMTRLFSALVKAAR